MVKRRRSNDRAPGLRGVLQHVRSRFLMITDMGTFLCGFRIHEVRRSTVRHDNGEWSARCSRCGCLLERPARGEPWRERGAP
jgi:hypothetical protein